MNDSKALEGYLAGERESMDRLLDAIRADNAGVEELLQAERLTWQAWPEIEPMPELENWQPWPELEDWQPWGELGQE